MYDICIIGAGPAGATLARMLDTNYRVLLVDRRPLDRAWAQGDASKPCGGLLAPRAQAELARQGLGVPSDVIGGPQLFAVRTSDLPSRLERLYQRFYVNVDREAFDRWLVSLVSPSVDIATGWRAVACEPDDSGVTVRFHTAVGGRASVRTRLVVGADGAGSLARRVVIPAWREAPRYTAVQARFRANADAPHYGAIFDESLTDFYGWTIPKGDSVLAGAAFPHGPGVLSAFDDFVSRARAAGLLTGDEISRESALISRPRSPLHIASGYGRVALLGEAAGLISPSSAEGISYALRSAAALADCTGSGLEGALDRYREAAAPLAFEVTTKLVKAGAIHGPGMRRLALASGVGSIRERRATLGDAVARPA